MHSLFRMLSDEDLVVLAQSANDEAFAELIRRHRAACLKLAWSILKDRSEAEDEVQNAVWRAFEHLSQFQREAKFSTWLTRIVVNQCLMRLRRQRRFQTLYFEDAIPGEDRIALDVRDKAHGPEEVLGQAEVAGILHREIGRIPPLLRDVLVLREMKELPMSEVARKLGITLAAAKSRLLRARAELRVRLAKHQGRMGPATLLG